MFIASGAQAMAAVAMPYQMTMDANMVMTNADGSAMTHADCGKCEQHEMAQVDQDEPCLNECQGCPSVCSFHFIGSINLAATNFPVEKPLLHEDNQISSTTDTLYRPPIFC
jgi:hypothetical protein